MRIDLATVQATLVCSVFALLLVGCSSTDAPPDTDNSPGPQLVGHIHLEELLAEAEITGGEVPSDLPPALVWNFSESTSGWRSLPTLIKGSRPAAVTHADDALRIELGPQSKSHMEQPDFYGGAVVDVEDFRFDDWSRALFELRPNPNLEEFGVGFALRTEAGDNDREKWPTQWYVGDPSWKMEGDILKVDVSLERTDDAPPGDQLIPQVAIEINGKEPISVDVLSVRFLPKAAVYASEGGYGVRSVSNSRHEAFGPQRQTIFAHAPAELSFKIEVPDEASLDFGLGSFGSGSRMAVRIEGAGGTSKTLLTEDVPTEHEWLQHSLDLSDWAGQSVTLTLAAERLAADKSSVAFWSAPTISQQPINHQTISQQETTTAAAAAAPDPAGPATPPNVIFYVIDGASAGNMSVYGYDRPTTPNLERIAAEGVVFERAHSNSTWTMPSTASFMTSLHQSVMGGLRKDANPVPPNVKTMAEHFHGAGFHTGVFSMNPNAASLSGLERGVDVMRDFGKRGKPIDPIYSISSEILHREYWDWRDAYSGPYWVHFQTTDVHPPYYPPEPFGGRMISKERTEELGKQMMSMRFPFNHKSASVHEHWNKEIANAGLDRGNFYSSMRDMHDETMMYQDHQLGKLVEDLKSRGEWQNTLLIIASDHGHPAASYPRWGRGMLEPQPPAYEGALLGKFESHIPLIFIWPAGIEGGQRVEEPVSMIDVLPTVLDLVGLPQPEIAQGKSLVPALRGDDGWTPGPVVFDEFRVNDEGEWIGNLEILDGRWGKSLEIRTVDMGDKPELGRHPAPAGGRWAAIESPEAPRFMLYDLEADPRAIQHVNDQHPDIVRESQRALWRIWKEHRELALSFQAGERGELSPEQIKALQALGYIQ